MISINKTKIKGIYFYTEVSINIFRSLTIPSILIFNIIFTIGFQLMAVTASAYLVAWGPFSVLCIWEMVVQPKVSLNQGHDGDGDD